MPIKRGGQTRSNAGRYAPEGQGATQRGRNLRTPSGRERPMQTARLPKATAEGTVTRTGASRAPQRSSGLSIVGDVMNVLSNLRRFGPAAAAYEVSKARPTAEGTLEAARKRGDYKPSQNVPNPQEGMTRAQSFDDAFASARKAGDKSFTWRGRTYNTKLRGEG
jgi:hypothetical protein